MASNKETALSFLRMVEAGKIREAYAHHVAGDFRSHNPFFGDSASDLMAAMEADQRVHPDKRLEVQHAIAEGDLVAVHSRLRMGADDPGIAAVHLFRFANGRIVELWDVGQPVPAESPNRRGMF